MKLKDFQKLREHIGKKVKVTYVAVTNRYVSEGILKEIHDRFWLVIQEHEPETKDGFTDSGTEWIYYSKIKSVTVL